MNNHSTNEHNSYSQKITKKEKQIDELSQAKRTYEKNLEKFHLDMKKVLSRDTEIASLNSEVNQKLEHELNHVVVGLQEEFGDRKMTLAKRLEDEREELYKERNDASW